MEAFGGHPYVAAVYALAPMELDSLADTGAPALYRALNFARGAARETLGLPAPARAVS